MDKRQFEELYNTAIQKIAVGFYILDNCGERLGYDIDTIQTNKTQLCDILATGVNLSVTTVYADSSLMYQRLPASYIRQLRASGLLEELIRAMQVALEQNSNLGYKTLDN